MYVNERVNEALMVRRAHCWQKRKYARKTMRIYSFNEFRSRDLTGLNCKDKVAGRLITIRASLVHVRGERE